MWDSLLISEIYLLLLLVSTVQMAPMSSQSIKQWNNIQSFGVKRSNHHLKLVENIKVNNIQDVKDINEFSRMFSGDTDNILVTPAEEKRDADFVAVRISVPTSTRNYSKYTTSDQRKTIYNYENITNFSTKNTFVVEHNEKTQVKEASGTEKKPLVPSLVRGKDSTGLGSFRRTSEDLPKKFEDRYVSSGDWLDYLSSMEVSCEEVNMKQENPRYTLPPNFCGLCPDSRPSFGLTPCKCSNNGGSLGGTINIDCPPDVSSQDELRDIIQRTTFISTNVSRFSLSKSNISGVLNLDMLSPLTVMTLVLNDDLFFSVDSHAFNASANSLISISVANNPITYFHFDSVNEVPKLQTLYLSGNALQFIPEDAFIHPKLSLLDLSLCDIYAISGNAFSGLIKIEIINLASNSLEKLDVNTFRIPKRDNNNVLQLDLSDNFIEYISPEAFSGLRNVHVNLMGNELRSLDEAVFMPLIVDSSYFAYFPVDDNPISCDCGIYWIVKDSLITHCFDNFKCADQNATLYQLHPDMFSDCVV